GALGNEDSKNYFWNVSAGFYGAALTYSFVENGYLKQRRAIETVRRVMGYAERSRQLGNSSYSRYQNIKKEVQRIERFKGKAQQSTEIRKLEYEYIIWQMQSHLLHELEIL